MSSVQSIDASIAAALEDIQLQKVLLQSLEEEEPDATAERDDILDEIDRLEEKLAALRKERFNLSGRKKSQPGHSSASKGLSSAQLDGSSDAPSRKHPRTDDLQLPPSKRSATSSDSASDDSHQDPSEAVLDELAGDDDLLELIGVDGSDTLRELQEEQRKAEDWLKERKTQEQKDAEFARMLQEGLYEPPRPASVASGSAQEGPSSSQPASPIAIHNSAPQGSLPPIARGPPPTAPAPTPVGRIPLEPSKPALAPRPSYPNLLPASVKNSDTTKIGPQKLPNNPFNGQIANRPQKSFPDYLSSTYPQKDFSQGLQNPLKTGPSSSGTALEPTGPKPSFPWQVPNPVREAIDSLNPSHLWDRVGSLWGGPSDPFLSPLGFDEFREYVFLFLFLLPFFFFFFFDLVVISSFLIFGLLSYLDDSGVTDPKQTQEEIMKLLETIRPDLQYAEKSGEGTPEALKYDLMEHQRIGLAWMKSMEESENKGGILADDMGLGKTMQAISLIVARPPTDPSRKTTLIITPVALLLQWKREIERMLRPGRHQRSVYIMHGKRQRFENLRNYDVVLTTYGTIASELKRKMDYEQMEEKGLNSRSQRNQMPFLGPSSKWYRVILDEAQCIKNRSAKAALGCCAIDSTHRWCMTGTPMMNNVGELHSLIRFLRIRPYNVLEKFNMVS